MFLIKNRTCSDWHASVHLGKTSWQNSKVFKRRKGVYYVKKCQRKLQPFSLILLSFLLYFLRPVKENKFGKLLITLSLFRQIFYRNRMKTKPISYLIYKTHTVSLKNLTFKAFKFFLAPTKIDLLRKNMR